MNTTSGDNAEAREKYDGYIVGIGASAGGLEALQKLLTALPPNTGFPYIIIQHLSPDYKSLLVEILGKYTEMPVIQVENGTEIKPNCVYVIQPGKNMNISCGRLFLTPQREKELNLPIDMFFRSLAEEAGSKAVAIVLSGTGSDGTNGIKDIKERDGMIIVQDLETSKFDGMPRSAMRTGLVDAQISPEEIALELQHISHAAEHQFDAIKPERKIDEAMMKKIYKILKKGSNINFIHYKQTTILRRIERRMMLAHKETMADYVEFLADSPEEVHTLAKEVLIGVTSFFRDPDYFECLKDKAVTDILLHSVAEESVRVWVAGCSTGEEAYSIAILFCEVMEKLKIKRTVKIFATDLDSEAISTAGKGVYGDNIIDSVSSIRLSRFFTRRGNTYVVNRDLRNMIIFSPHNVFQDPPFGGLDLISCRNMLIYFQPVLQNDLFSIFHTVLKNNGYLFLGKSEAIGAFTDAFPVVNTAARIFTHRSSVKIPNQKTIPFLQTSYFEDELIDEYGTNAPRKAEQDPGHEKKVDPLDMQLLEQFMPACLVVNEKNDLIHIFGESRNFLHMPVGKFTNNLFELITEALKIPVSTLLKEAREKKCMVQYKDIAFAGERESAVTDLTVSPMGGKGNDNESLYALVFTESTQKDRLPDAVSYDIDRAASQRITDLEQELSEAQDKLSRSIAEQECVNEELQAANEELLTANEELQSSNEELQSVNEELYTVNSEYQQKLTELADLNDDIANFLSSTLTGIIFVDNKLNIRRYTDYVTAEFSIMDHDIGRSLKFISYHFPTVDITEICENVLKTLVPDEREITTSKNKAFFMRVAPYRSTENKILGCVITLVDITKQKQGQLQLASTEKQLSIAKDAMEARSGYLSNITRELKTPVSALKAQLHLLSGTAGAETLEEMTKLLDCISTIVDDISEAAGHEPGAKDSDEEFFTLGAMTRSVDTLIRKTAAEAGVEYCVHIQGDADARYGGDSVSVRQVLINLLSCSIRRAGSGGSVTLRAEAETDTSLRFTIADTGAAIRIGAVAEAIKNGRHPAPGSGHTDVCLEIFIANDLVRAMGGTLEVENNPSGGAAFTACVPVGTSKAPLPETPQAAPEGLKGLNVLIAEDNAVNRLILCRLLSRGGITCVETDDGDAAVKAFIDAPEHTFDCVLMDMRMPTLDGIRATEMIRASRKGDAETVPIIGVSANGFADDIRKARDAGVNEYTTKPIDRENLINAIRSVTGRN